MILVDTQQVTAIWSETVNFLNKVRPALKIFEGYTRLTNIKTLPMSMFRQMSFLLFRAVSLLWRGIKPSCKLSKAFVDGKMSVNCC